ncbi:hypothetical protein [Tetragenococcus solitarius]|uniref:Uncharacterized protein n=1 Tax=Tetragenococcus solitarius TaxID=71453 RepID=A0ABN3Y8U1_9ENTE|nr:hypothetical protein [Tetragenococcus solitarius]
MADDKKEQTKEEVYAQRQSDYKDEKEKVFKEAQKVAADNEVIDPEKLEGDKDLKEDKE